MRLATLFSARTFPLWLSLALLLSVWADPAFAKIGLFEMSLATAIAIMGVLALKEFIRSPDLTAWRRNSPLVLYLLSLTLVLLIGFITGADPKAIFRSVAPYFLIGLAALMIFRNNPKVDHTILLYGILLAGSIQGTYLIWLYLSVNNRFDSEFEIMLHRITLIDGRTTIPMAIAAIPAAIVLSHKSKSVLTKLSCYILATILMLASFTLLARTHVFSAAIGVCVIFILALARFSISKPTWARPGLILTTMSSMLLAGIVIATVPAFNILPKTIFLRQAIETDQEHTNLDIDILKRSIDEVISSADDRVKTSNSFDVDDTTSPEKLLQRLQNLAGYDNARKVLDAYSQNISTSETGTAQGTKQSQAIRRKLEVQLTRAVVAQNNGSENTLGSGRIEDEIIPAWQRFMDAGIAEKFFGIGAGNSFQTKSGEARTYIHNYPFYLLLFHGIFGLAAFLIMMGWVCWRLLLRWWVDGDANALAILGVAAAIYSNSLLFAAHKLISFNLLVLAIVLVGCTANETVRTFRRPESVDNPSRSSAMPAA